MRVGGRRAHDPVGDGVRRARRRGGDQATRAARVRGGSARRELDGGRVVRARQVAARGAVTCRADDLSTGWQRSRLAGLVPLERRCVRGRDRRGRSQAWSSGTRPPLRAGRLRGRSAVPRHRGARDTRTGRGRRGPVRAAIIGAGTSARSKARFAAERSKPGVVLRLRARPLGSGIWQPSSPPQRPERPLIRRAGAGPRRAGARRRARRRALAELRRVVAEHDDLEAPVAADHRGDVGGDLGERTSSVVGPLVPELSANVHRSAETERAAQPLQASQIRAAHDDGRVELRKLLCEPLRLLAAAAIKRPITIDLHARLPNPRPGRA